MGGTEISEMRFTGQTIEKGREQQVTSYLRQWTKLIRLQGRGVTPVQPYSCPEMWLYWQDYSHLCSLISWVLLAQIWHQQPPCHSLYITYYFMNKTLKIIAWLVRRRRRKGPMGPSCRQRIDTVLPEGLAMPIGPSYLQNCPRFQLFFIFLI